MAVRKRKQKSWRARRTHSAKIAARIARRDGAKCYYCRVKLNIKLYGRKRKSNRDPRGARLPTIDHVVPKSSGKYNRDRMANMVLACLQCNDAKGSMSVDEFMKTKEGEQL